MATLHIFNPDHDIALAANLANFTAPHAGRQLRNDLGFLPLLWAAEDDVVLVDNVEAAEKASRRLRSRWGLTGCRFVDKHQLADMAIDGIAPWGWDLALQALLKRQGVSDQLLPDAEQLEQVRQLSHRRTAAALLEQLQGDDGIVGEAYECDSIDEVETLLARYGQVVMKAPWSSSGRGVRFCDAAHLDERGETGLGKWVCNVIARQGSIMVEPFYQKVKDVGMEFEATDEGVRYLGLSLFHTRNGAYTGNVLATEQAKLDMISRYIPECLLYSVQQSVVQRLDLDDYRGPFGIDMMVVRGDGETEDGSCRLHPCVEINLRRTMGHVALAVGRLFNPTTDDDIQGVMHVVYNGTNYQLKIIKLKSR